MDSGALGGQLQEVMNQYQGMAPATQGAITDDLMSRVDYFRPQYEELAGLEAQAYASPASQMQQYNEQFGTGMDRQYGPSAMGQLSSIMGNIGQQFGTIDTLGNVLNTQQGRIEQLAGNAMDQYNAQRQAVMDRYNMLTPLYQAAISREEAAKSRAASARQTAQMANLYGNMLSSQQPQTQIEIEVPSGVVPYTQAELAPQANEIINANENASNNNVLDNMIQGNRPVSFSGPTLMDTIYGTQPTQEQQAYNRIRNVLF